MPNKNIFNKFKNIILGLKEYSIPFFVFITGFLLCFFDPKGFIFGDDKFIILLFSTLVAASKTKSSAAIAAKIMVIPISLALIYFIANGAFVNEQWMAMLGFLGIIIVPLGVMAMIALYGIIALVIFVVKNHREWLLAQDIAAVDGWRQAADRGDIEAQFKLGDAYYKGKGVEKDVYEAIKWYSIAAEQGNASAQFMLGYAYLEGNGVEKDKCEAIKWLRKSAAQGDVDAQMALINM